MKRKRRGRDGWLEDSQCLHSIPPTIPIVHRELKLARTIYQLSVNSFDIDCVRPLYLAVSPQTKEQQKRGIGERWRSGGRISPLDTSDLFSLSLCKHHVGS